MKQKKMLCTAAATLVALALAACGGATPPPAAAPSGAASAGSAGSADADFTIGIVQYTQHSSLDEICAAVQNELEVLAATADVKLNVIVKNGQGDAPTINDICSLFVADKVDLIIPIATPAATSAAAATQGTGIPLVFSAVTDPVEAQLVESMEAPGGSITGTSDYIDTSLILKLATTQNPELKKLGLIYNLGEPNSVATIAKTKPILEEQGIAYVESTVTTPGEVQMAAQKLISEGAEAIFVPIDNTVASAMSVLADEAIKAGVPVYTAADSMVRDGGLATTGVNYTRLGELTAQMAFKVLYEKADPASMAVQVLNDGIVTVNTTTAEALGIDPDVFDPGEGYVAVE